jgi:anti-sigma regulatory factor (Ser/Thr protein kinase)
MHGTPQKGEVTLLRLETPARAESIQTTRRAAEALGHLHRSADLGARLAVVVTELATNVVEHSSSRTIEVELALSSDRLTGSVRDDGGGFVAGRLPRPRRDAVGGRGLYLLDALTDEWRVDTSCGTCVSFAFSLEDSLADQPLKRSAGEPERRRPAAVSCVSH